MDETNHPVTSQVSEESSDRQALQLQLRFHFRTCLCYPSGNADKEGPQDHAFYHAKDWRRRNERKPFSQEETTNWCRKLREIAYSVLSF